MVQANEFRTQNRAQHRRVAAPCAGFRIQLSKARSFIESFLVRRIVIVYQQLFRALAPTVAQLSGLGCGRCVGGNAGLHDLASLGRQTHYQHQNYGRRCALDSERLQHYKIDAWVQKLSQTLLPHCGNDFCRLPFDLHCHDAIFVPRCGSLFDPAILMSKLVFRAQSLLVCNLLF